jgi:hypothetical protein
MIIGLVLSVCHRLHPCSAFMSRTYVFGVQSVVERVFGVQSVVERKTPPPPTADTDPFEFDSGAPKEPINTDHVCGPSPGPPRRPHSWPPLRPIGYARRAMHQLRFRTGRHQRTHSGKLTHQVTVHLRSVWRGFLHQLPTQAASFSETHAWCSHLSSVWRMQQGFHCERELVRSHPGCAPSDGITDLSTLPTPL